MKNRKDKNPSDSFRWHFDEQFPGPFADISYDDFGPIVVLPDPMVDDDSYIPDLMVRNEVM